MAGVCTLQGRKILQECTNPEGWWLLKQEGEGGMGLLGLIQSLEQKLGCPPILHLPGLGGRIIWKVGSCAQCCSLSRTR